MLTDRLRQLLTAYVDGELSARQRRAVQRLLRRSAEARELVQKLQCDAEQLRHLPRKNLAADFGSQVLLAITEQGLEPVRRPRMRTPATIPSWLGLAVAASVLLVISAGSYLYFVASSAQNTSTAGNGNRTGAEESPAPSRAPGDPSTLARDSLPAPLPDRAVRPDPRPDPLVQKAVPDEGPPETPQPNRDPDTILTTPNPKMELFPQIADTRLALILSLGQLDQPQPRKELADELQKDTAYRIELACQEGSKAMDQLRTAFQAQGIRLVIDQVAQNRLKAKLRTSYALYVENVKPDEVSRILSRLGEEDKKAKPRRQFDQVVLQRMTPEDHKEVAKLLGVGPKPKSPRDVDLHQPLSKTTADQVEQALKGQGVRPAPGKPAAKPGERLAVVVPYNPVRPPAASPQVKQFLDSRKERLPNTVQLVLVLRGNNG